MVETDALLTEASGDTIEITGEPYGPLKVACERIVREAFGDADLHHPLLD